MDQRLVVARKLLATLEQEGFAARLAGGCVRDRVLKREPKDYDIATDAVPEKVIELAQKHRFKAVPTGLDHGTVTVIINSIPTEITTLRTDLETDGRHAIVRFGKSFEEDAARRDFTMNAMFEDKDGQIYDYFEGQKDLQARVLKFVGDPSKRMQEDYLRIMRLFRFWGELDIPPSDQTLNILAKHVADLKVVSVERIWAELEKILDVGHPKVLPKMVDLGVFQRIFPHHPCNTAPTLQNFMLFKNMPAQLRAWFRLAAIGFSEGMSAHQLQTALRLSNRQADLIDFLLRGTKGLTAAGKSVSQSLVLKRDWQNAVTDLSFDLFLDFARSVQPHSDDRQDSLDHVVAHCLQHSPRLLGMPVTATLLQDELGMSPSKLLGATLSYLDLAYLEGQWGTVEEGLELAKTYIDSSPK